MVKLTPEQRQKIKEREATLKSLKDGLVRETFHLKRIKVEFKDKSVDIRSTIKSYKNEINRQKKSLAAYKKGK
jgi:hypothetical protein